MRGSGNLYRSEYSSLGNSPDDQPPSPPIRVKVPVSMGRKKSSSSSSRKKTSFMRSFIEFFFFIIWLICTGMAGYFVGKYFFPPLFFHFNQHAGFIGYNPIGSTDCPDSFAADIEEPKAKRSCSGQKLTADKYNSFFINQFIHKR